MKKVRPEVTPLLVSRSHAAQALGLSERSVDMLIKSDRLVHVRLGKRVMVSSADLTAFARTGTPHLIRTNNEQ